MYGLFSVSGMFVEYLKALCGYTDWQIEYVECDSWGEALNLLSEHRVDLVGSAQYSAERAEIYDESFEAMLKECHEREKLLESVELEGNFVAYYQNKVDIRMNKIVGAEVLVRFFDPSPVGVVRAPYYFVPYYEQTGRIVEIDFFVMGPVCKMLRRRIDAGKAIVPVSCNFSRMHFARPRFPERFVEEKFDRQFA